MKYSFIMPYWKRSSLLKETLQSYKLQYQERNDYEIIIIEDFKNQIDEIEHANLIDVLSNFPDLLIKVIQRPSEQTFNPCQHYNQGVAISCGEYLLLTNPECKHVSNILGGLDETFIQQPNAYVVCACFDTSYAGYWYQHSIYNNRKLHFCTAINKQTYMTIGGFDENYKDGISFDDDDFIATVDKHEIEIITRDDLVVEHQSHEHFKWNYPELLYKNQNYYQNKWGRSIPV
jgi:hypothetical protein